METNALLDPKPTNLLQGIDTIIVRVSNVQASQHWYTQTLGFTTAWEAPEMSLTVLDTGGPTSLTLWQTDKPIAPNTATATYPIFRTPDAATLHRELTARGVRTGELTPDPYVISFTFSDPDGNHLEACQVLG